MSLIQAAERESPATSRNPCKPESGFKLLASRTKSQFQFIRTAYSSAATVTRGPVPAHPCHNHPSDLWVTPAHGTAPLRIGTRDFASFFLRAIREVRLWSRALTHNGVIAGATWIAL
jgi:hypothetical protein